MIDLSQRRLVPEQMDAPDADPTELAAALGFIRRVNAMLRYNATVVKAFEGMVSTLDRDRALSVLDVATGSADLLIDLNRAGQRGGRSLELIGVDRHPTTMAEARRVCGGVPNIRLIEADALALPFADASVDVVMSTMFLHHLPEEVAVAALREMGRVARRGLILADLLRDRRAYRWISLFTLFARPMVRHDARASVAHAFTMQEAQALAERAGLTGAQLRRTFGHRFLLTWSRED